MSQIQSSTDITGALSQTDLNAQDIQNIIDEFNKFQDQYTAGNIQQNQQSIIVFDDSTNRVLIGYQTVLQQWGLFVSKPGVDVTEATADQLVFNSEQDVFKIVSKVPISVSVVAPGAFYGQTVIPHGLDYTPSFQADQIFSNDLQALGSFTSTTNHSNPALVYGTVSTNLVLFAISELTVDATNVYLTLQMAPSVANGTYTVNGTAYLEQETFS